MFGCTVMDWILMQSQLHLYSKLEWFWHILQEIKIQQEEAYVQMLGK